VYSTLQNPNYSGFKADIAVFTSPSNVEIAAKFNDLKSLTCVAIGQTTAQALKALGCTTVSIAPFTTEQALADLVCGLS